LVICLFFSTSVPKTFAATNLLTNGDFSTGDSTGWTIVDNGGSGATFGGGNYATSYTWCSISQTIDLVAAGYTEGQLDAAPNIDFDITTWQRFDHDGYYYLEYKLLAADGTTPIATKLYGSVGSPIYLAADTSEFQTPYTFSSYGSGARYAYIKIAGQDGSPDWGGQYGPYFNTATISMSDSTAPSVSTLSPADEAVSVAVDANLVITFDEAVNQEAGADNDVVIKTTVGDTTVETIDTEDAKVTGDGTTTITINPDTTLTEQTGYYVQIGADAFDDAAGNSYAGISDTTSWSFTTGDFTNPSVSSLSPEDGASGINLDANLVITFDEAVDVESGNITIKKTADDTTFETIDVTSGQVTGTGTTTITINPSSDLVDPTGQGYYVQIDATAFDDTSSNSYAGIADTTTWNFMSAAVASTSKDAIEPYIVSFSPGNNEESVSTNPSLEIIFSETVYATNAKNGDIQIFKSEDDSLVASPDFNNLEVYGWGSRTIKINPKEEFEPGTQYYVTISFKAFHDLANNYFEGISDKTTWSFTTEGEEEPELEEELVGEGDGTEESEEGSEVQEGTVEEIQCADVEETHWAFDMLKQLINENKYPVSFNEEGAYQCQAKEELTRGEMIEWLVSIKFPDEIENFDQAELEPLPFTDLSSDDANLIPIIIAYQHGIVSGYGDATFKADQIVNRAETLKILWNVFVGGDEELQFMIENYYDDNLIRTFDDITKEYEWYYPYLFYAAQNGLVEGRTKAIEGETARLAKMYSPVLYSEVAKLIYLMQ
jgi:hypothetical protein